MKISHLILIKIFFLHSQLIGQIETANTENSLSISAIYTGDFLSIISGGLRKGVVYLGKGNFLFDFDTENAGLWHGGKFFLNASSTHGAKPSNNFIGDYQIASNIEAGDRTFVQELWIQQSFDKMKLIFGIQDLSTEFAGCCTGNLFLNSSFGIHPTITTNIPASVYPLTSVGITGILTITQSWNLKLAIYDGAPTAIEQNPYNLNWKFHNSEGIINIAEAEYKSEQELIKLGLYHHDHLYEAGKLGTELIYEHNIGLYTTFDLLVKKFSDNSNFNLFAQAAVSSRTINSNYWYLGFGLKITNLTLNIDEIGLAIAHAGLRSILDETVFELTYKRMLNEAIYIQPDIQFIFNPAGSEFNKKNSIVFSVRTGIEF